MSSLIGALPSLRKLLVILYIIVNLKSAPFVWHLRVLWHFVTNIRRRPTPPKSPPSLTAKSPSRRALAHPLFMPVSIYTRTPLLESDYNMHKSNSTYFSDMDVARTKLVTRLVSPGMKKASLELERQGYKGRITVVLGSVHVSFRREVGIFEKIEIRSRLLGWDAKWLLVVSYFVRKAGKGGKEELCATGLSKYVCKKGRYTVRPDLVFGLGGWLPQNRTEPEAEHPVPESAAGLLTPPEDGRSSQVQDQATSVTETGDQTSDVDGINSVQSLHAAETVVLDQDAADKASTEITQENQRIGWDPEQWKWDDIESERLLGLGLAKGWLALDQELYEGFAKT